MIRIFSSVRMAGAIAWIAMAASWHQPLSAGLPIVREGRAVAEIVIPRDPMPQVVLAAEELRDHLRKISGATLTITDSPTGESRYPIHVGHSDAMRRLGLCLDAICGEGYRIVATEDYLALFGHDEIFPFYPRGHTHASRRERLLQEWQAYSGEEWDFPFLQFYDPRNFNPEFGFSLFDPSGTLFAVYEFLEQLGVRWYMPHHDFGTVIPESADVSAALQDITRRPEFERRYLRIGWGTDRETFLWSKRQRLGLTELAWICHGTSHITRFAQDRHPEYLTVVDGRRQTEAAFGGPGQSRLAAPLRDAMIRYANAFFDQYPETRYVSVGPNDGYTQMDDRDRAAGWLREQRGPRGRLSDYVWTFIDEVAEGVASSHPDKIVMGLAYSGYREPPADFDRLRENVGVTYCQSRSHFFDQELKANIFREREKWLAMLSSDEFFIWEYFLWHRQGQQLWGVPVIFWRTLQEDMLALRGRSKGEYVEAWPLQQKKLWGINHLTIYLQARLYWEPELDLEAFLDEYYRTFYGPAAPEMREFFEFAESVWMRPASRTIFSDDGFLQPPDIERYFDILDRALAKVESDTDYGRRVALIAEECGPMQNLFAYQDFEAEGRAAAAAGDGARAAEYLRKALDAATGNRERANTALALGNVYRDLLQDDARALEAFRTAMQTTIRGAGSAVRMHARMAAVDVLRRNKRFDEAIALLDDFSGALRHDYWRVVALSARAGIARDQDELDAARAYYREALDVPGIDDRQGERLRSQLAEIQER